MATPEAHQRQSVFHGDQYMGTPIVWGRRFGFVFICDRKEGKPSSALWECGNRAVGDFHRRPPPGISTALFFSSIQKRPVSGGSVALCRRRRRQLGAPTPRAAL